jgi:hypothetical protein
MLVEQVAGSPWNGWPDAHGIRGRITVVRAPKGSPAHAGIGELVAFATSEYGTPMEHGDTLTAAADRRSVNPPDRSAGAFDLIKTPPFSELGQSGR